MEYIYLLLFKKKSLSACQVKYHKRDIAINENHFQVLRQKQKVICSFVLQRGGHHAILLEQ